MELRRLLALLASLSLVAVVPLDHAEGQCRINEGVKLTASDGEEGDLFGYSVSISGDAIVVGAYSADNASITAGSAYVYRLDRNKWVEEQRISAFDGGAGDQFGVSVSVSGDLTMVGSRLDDDAGGNSGSVYAYRFNGRSWVDEQKLNAPDAAAGDYFGFSVSISGDVAVIGAYGDDDEGGNSGSAYVYRFDGSNWIEEQKLTVSDGAPNDRRGWSVSINGDVAVVGAWGDDDEGEDSGSAYVYRLDGGTWVEEQKLTASDGAASDWFGRSVAINGDVAVAGAIGDYDAGSFSGAAYVYRFNGSTWVQEQKLTASDLAQGDVFGRSVAVSGNVVVVGVWADDDAANNSGSAYVYGFNGSSWVEIQKLTASDAAVDDRFGTAVSITGEVAVVGAVIDHYVGTGSGSAYVFGINPVPSDPPCGAIDARQPSASDGGDSAGWDSIAMTFGESPGEMNAEDIAIVISPPGDVPIVTDVTVDGNTATVHLDDFIPTQAWTTLTHWPTGAVTRIGYLSADVNNDKLSNENDVIYLIDVLNGDLVPAPPAYQTDTDRSGATNANDVLRVIDLLNGAGVYEEYLDAELPA